MEFFTISRGLSPQPRAERVTHQLGTPPQELAKATGTKTCLQRSCLTMQCRMSKTDGLSCLIQRGPAPKAAQATDLTGTTEKGVTLHHPQHTRRAGGPHSHPQGTKQPAETPKDEMQLFLF